MGRVQLFATSGWSFVSFIACVGLGFAATPQEPSSIAPFAATATDGTKISVDQGSAGELTVVCFLGNDCPLVKWYASRLQSMSEKYADRSVKFLAVNSNHQDTPEEIAAFVREHSLRFPMIADSEHRLANHFQAERTPEIFVLDQDLAVRYRGRVDDQYQPGVARSEAQRRDLELAIEQLLAGQPVEVSRTAALGCLIGRVAKLNTAATNDATGENPTPTFAEHVAPVVYQHCGECHRPNDIGPFSLIDYDEVKGWGAMMVEVIDQGLMPPWHANPEYGKFSNHRELPESDKQLIRDWVAAGAPLGDPSKLPPAPESAGEWLLPKAPDLIVAMGSTPFEVPAQGTVDYKYFVVDPGLTEDRWVKGAQIIPGNRSVVHHSIVFIKPPGEESDSGQGWLSAYVPGQRPLTYAPGYARRIPAGSKFVFQQHYTTNGKPAEDITRIGLVFADPAEITHAVDTLVALNQTFEIPPHHPNHQVEGSLKQVPQQAMMLGLSPHMHYRGKSFQLKAFRNDATEPAQVILDVPRYDFNWQHVYAFSEPLLLEGISRIDFVAAFDNSADNPANPDPSRTVTWGDQSWEEMAIVYFDVAWRIRPDQVSGQPATATDSTELQFHDDVAIEELVTKFFAKFAPPNSDRIPKQALPEAIRRFAGLDDDNDGEISRDELRNAFRKRAERQQRRADR
ncbi:MAG: redoxin domain-containing protein [Pirellulaceae bacterium]|nr:redoxin domain-containing protein [Pirellulaceae bacterium]